MIDGALSAALAGLGAGLLLALAVWALSVPLHDVSIVDSAWSLLVMAPAAVAAWQAPALAPAAWAALALAAAWALRLAGHITWRHWGHGRRVEDRRYQAIRRRNQPHFAAKSLVIVFALQAVLAWIVAAPLVALATRDPTFDVLATCGLALAAFGLVFEAVADAQLEAFKRNPVRRGTVMDRGLWRYSRHPNYFGEFCVWWGFWLVAASAGAWWTVVSPLLMSALLLRVSGVPLLEQDIADRRPGYRAYVERTNAFFPAPPRS